MLLRENRTMEKAQNPIICFVRWLSKNENSQIDFFAKIAWHDLCQEGKNAHVRAHYLFWPKIFWAQNSETTKNYKNRGFSRNFPKPKRRLFFGKKEFFCGMGEEVFLY